MTSIIEVMPTLSIVVPCYNEEATVSELLQRVLAADLAGYEREIIVVDDGSTDKTVALIEKMAMDGAPIKLLRQPRNFGKGAAVRRGFREANGDLIVIQDADLEYNPQDFKQMLTLFDSSEVKVVFGSRRMQPDNNHSGLLYYWGAQGINLVTNLLYGVSISDQFTCYKMMRRSVLDKLELTSDGFEFDAELVAKLLKAKQKIYEVPITYQPRSRAEGKKIRVSDGIKWAGQIIKYRVGR